MVERKRRKYTIEIRVVKTLALSVKRYTSVKEARKEIGAREDYTIVRVLNRFTKVLCEKCQYNIKSGFKFCPRCGTKQ